MELDKALIQECVNNSNNRFEFWIMLINRIDVQSLVEIGVYRGEFSEKIMRGCEAIKEYYMIDPWRNLENWDKPLNKDDNTFDECFDETMRVTEFASNKRVVLRGKTTEVIDDITDNVTVRTTELLTHPIQVAF